MKKLINLFFITLLTTVVFAQEQILFDSSVKADLNGFDYVSNFEITSDSGYFSKSNLEIIEPNEKGIRFCAKNVPNDTSTSYKILTAYPSFLNESIDGAGVIYNAASIKTVKITATTNRPYDEIILLYSTSPNGNIKEIKMPQNFDEIRSMEEFTLVYENPLYEKNVKKRELTTSPVLGAEVDGLYLRGFRIKTNAPNGFNVYSPYSAFYLKSVSVVCDKAFTEEQISANKALKEEFKIDENKNERNKAIKKVEEKNRIMLSNEALMASKEETIENAK